MNQTIISNEECSKSTGFQYICNLEPDPDTTINGTITCDTRYNAIIGSVNISYEGRILDGMMCTESEGRGECQGDSGGPLTVNENGKHILVGVVSWSNGCAKVISIIYVSMWWRFLSIPSNTLIVLNPCTFKKNIATDETSQVSTSSPLSLLYDFHH